MGPKPAYESGSVEEEMAARVRPQKFSLANKMRTSLFGIPCVGFKGYGLGLWFKVSGLRFRVGVRA